MPFTKIYLNSTTGMALKSIQFPFKHWKLCSIRNGVRKTRNFRETLKAINVLIFKKRGKNLLSHVDSYNLKNSAFGFNSLGK